MLYLDEADFYFDFIFSIFHKAEKNVNLIQVNYEIFCFVRVFIVMMQLMQLKIRKGFLKLRRRGI